MGIKIIIRKQQYWHEVCNNNIKQFNPGNQERRKKKKKMTKEERKQLEEKLPEHAHKNKEENAMSQDEWIAASRPFIWSLIETKEKYSLYADEAYGLLALFSNGMLIKATTSNIFGHENILVLDKHYYGLNKYLWS